ncbi:MAG: xanthine dehydrogenase family protein subunit M [Albidovulum sp.]
MQYLAAKTADEAASALAAASGLTRVLAGGTDVLVQLKAGLVEPDLIVDIKKIPGIREITAEAGGFRIGAGVSGAEIGEHAGICAAWPGVAEGVQLIGSTQVQGRCTMVGNLCNASPAGDAVPPLVAANAVARITGPNGTRDCAVADIPSAPGRTNLKKGEIITSIFLPARPDRASDAYLRFIPRTEMDIAVASAGVSLELNADGTVKTACVVLGAVAPTIVVAQEAGKLLVGSKLDDATLVKLAAACEAVCNPITDKRGTIEYRTKTAGTLAKRAALIAYARAGGSK